MVGTASVISATAKARRIFEIPAAAIFSHVFSNVVIEDHAVMIYFNLVRILVEAVEAYHHINKNMAGFLLPRIAALNDIKNKVRTIRTNHLAGVTPIHPVRKDIETLLEGIDARLKYLEKLQEYLTVKKASVIELVRVFYNQKITNVVGEKAVIDPMRTTMHTS